MEIVVAGFEVKLEWIEGEAHAIVREKPEIRGKGRTENEAIGDLVRSQQKIFSFIREQAREQAA